MKRKQIVERINKLIKESFDSRGPTPKLYTDANFQRAFVDAIIEVGENGGRVHKLLNSQGHKISYKQCQEYMRRIFGTYPVTGRPPKYLKEERRRTA